MDFSMSWDPRSLSEIAQLIGFNNYLGPEIQMALDKAGDILVPNIQNSMHWKSGQQGPLFDSIHAIRESPYEIQAGSDLPYAWRRDRGFEGPDSLGRVYHDEGAFYAEQGLEASQEEIMALLNQGVIRVFERIGAY